MQQQKNPKQVSKVCPVRRCKCHEMMEQTMPVMAVKMLLAVLLLSTIQATPTGTRNCLQFGTTSTTNTIAQNGRDVSDDYYSYDDQVEPLDDPVIDKNTSTVVACSRSAMFCYALWTFDAVKNASKVVVQGCWDLSDKKESCNNAECISTKETKSGHFFCCCSGDNCNGNFSYASSPTSLDGVSVRSENDITPYAPYTSIWSSPTVYICFAMVAIILMLIVGFLTCRQSTKAVPELSQLVPSGPGYSSNLYNVDNLKLVSMIGQGKYGTVWKGIVNEQPVAVKIFSAQHRQYFLNERDIYTVPLMESPALLTYFGCDERRNLDDRVEYLLVLSLAPLGCLQDWLTDNRMPFNVFCKMGKSIANGLAHLHSEVRKGDLIKPCICHRDLNSRNILVKADLSCCICDLGFAMKTFGPRYECRGEIALAETKSINEVGTIRYMAPEVLEGAVNLRDCESALKQIDVYSLGLVLWELSTRCQEFFPDEESIPEYRAPYEEYVGSHPSFEQMQVLVSRNKARPSFVPCYETSVAARVIRDTCEDCWDHDAEARLTALCVQERIQEIHSMNPRAQLHRAPVPLNANNLIISPSAVPKVSPTTIVTFTTPPNQQIAPVSCKYREDTSGSGKYPKMNNNSTSLSSSVSSKLQILPPMVAVSNGLQRQNLNNNAYLPDEEDKFKSLVIEQHQVLLRTPKLDNGDSQKRTKGLNSVKAMLQKTFHKHSHPHDVQQDYDRKANVNDGMIAYNGPERVGTAERPNNLDLTAGNTYENNLIRTVNESSKFKSLTEDFTNQPFTMIQPDSPERKLRIVISKSANAVKTLNASRSSLVNEADDNHFLKRQRSLEVFQEVFGPKGSIERLRNPSQRVKTPGDVPPSVRKVRASKTLSLYDDRMMMMGAGGKLANSV